MMLHASQEAKAKTWWDIIGPVYRYEDLPPDAQENEGLIVLTTTDDTKFCPVKQFNPQIVTERGSIAAIVDEWVGKLWQIAKEFEIRQLGFGEWSTAVSILYPLKGESLSVVEKLFACSDDSSREQVIKEYVERSEMGAAWNGIVLTLPKKRLGTSE